MLRLTERGGREAAVGTRGRRAATAACAAAIVVLGIFAFATPALASDGTSTATAANATEVPQPVDAEQPAAGDSTAATITQHAEAGAVATQEGASNNTTTSADEPQTGGGVAQGNGASADATASTDASVNGQLNNDDSTDVVLTTDLTQSVGATAEVQQGLSLIHI